MAFLLCDTMELSGTCTPAAFLTAVACRVVCKETAAGVSVRRLAGVAVVRGIV